MPPRPRIPDGTLTMLVNEGWTTTRIAERFALTTQQVQRQRRRLQLGTDAPPRVDQDRAVELLRRGVPAADVAQQLRCSTRTIERIRSKFDIPLQRPQRPLSWDELAAVELLLAEGASVREAMRSIGRPEKTWIRSFRGRGWSPEQRAEYARTRRLARRAGIDL